MTVLDALYDAVGSVPLLSFSRTDPDSRSPRTQQLLRRASEWLRTVLSGGGKVGAKAFETLLLLALRSGAQDDYVAMLYYLVLPAERARFLNADKASDRDMGTPLAVNVDETSASFANVPLDDGIFPLATPITSQINALAKLQPVSV